MFKILVSSVTMLVPLLLLLLLLPLIVVDGSSHQHQQQPQPQPQTPSLDTTTPRSFEELVLTADHRQLQESLELRCGACWCIAVDEPNGQCPTDTTGITDFSSSEQLELSELYLKFDLDNPREPFLELSPTADDGSVACYPFADAVGPQDYTESNFPQCTKPATSDAAVCAYFYDISSETCVQRSYDVYTYDSADQATSNGAEIVHKGACGVCSSAQDFGARIKTYEVFDDELLVCSKEYMDSGDFNALIDCISVFGFTVDCTTLWAHFAATTVSLCANDCVRFVGSPNGPPPECAPSDCLTCQSSFKSDFDDLAGLVFTRAGITDEIAQPCSDFYRVVHDPCEGFAPDQRPPTAAPRPDETPSSANSNRQSTSSLYHTPVVLVLIGIFSTMKSWI